MIYLAAVLFLNVIAQANGLRPVLSLNPRFMPEQKKAVEQKYRV